MNRLVTSAAVLLLSCWIAGCGANTVQAVSEPPQKPLPAPPVVKAVTPEPAQKPIAKDLPQYIQEILLENRKGIKSPSRPKTIMPAPLPAAAETSSSQPEQETVEPEAAEEPIQEPEAVIEEDENSNDENEDFIEIEEEIDGDIQIILEFSDQSINS